MAMMTTVLMVSCSAPSKVFSAKGTVQNIEFGKDGYTAALKDDEGKDFDAVISRVKLQAGYRELKSGEVVKLSGDTMSLDNRLRIIVNKIEP
ncbi:hypothetical protein EGI32_00385 [Ferruginibacter sp. HRS2-29]|nr:hypothetical protein [Ferruginibacter sp. HRS2-29]